ncbi:MAG: hypothetical protein EOM37_09445 [Proteobacteria bacterium]|nr:hypothetical protein [Pseudomonadota bacterium]
MSHFVVGPQTQPINQGLDQLQQPGQGVPQAAHAPQGVQPAQIAQIQQQGRQVTGQQPLRSLGPTISTSTQTLQRATAQWQRTLPPQGSMPKTIGVTMPPSGQTVQLDGKMVEHEINALPESQRQDAVRDMPRVLQERVDSGHRVWEGVSNGTLLGPASLEDVRDLMTFLLAKGMEKGDGFSEGAFNISDPDHRLRDFLDSSPEVYQRPSSHIEGFQQAPGGSHRGIDVGGNVTLPYGKATLLYGGINAGVQGMGEDRLFLKTEEHGCRLSSRWTPNRDQNMRTDRPKRFGDVGQFLGHAAGFFRTVLRGISGGLLFPNAKDSRKERIPGDVTKDFKTILKGLDRSGKAEIAGILRQNDPLATSQGIRVMVANLNEALARQDLDQPTREAMQHLSSKLSTRFDHLDVRIGNEVVLSQDELAGPAPQQAVNGAMRAAVNSLLTIPDRAHFTPDKVESFVQQLGKIGTRLDRAGGGDETSAMIRTALEQATATLTPGQRAQLQDILTAPQCREAMAAINDVMAFGGENLGPMNPTARNSASQIAHKINHAYLGLCSQVGLPDEALPRATQQAMDLIKPILVRAGSDAFLSTAQTSANQEHARQIQQGGQQVGLMRLETVRPLIGRGVVALGDHMQGIAHGQVDHEQISRFFATELGHDVRTPQKGEPAGLGEQFVKDFFRNGISVNGQHFGGQGTGIPETAKREALQAFIDAAGGLPSAQQIARVAHQGLMGMMSQACIRDPGLNPLFMDFSMHGGNVQNAVSPNTGQPASMMLSVITHGDSVAVHCETNTQKVNDIDGNDQVGSNMSLDFTIQGTGSDDPVVRLDDWDALFSSCPN